jgi:hypothetical protein
MKNKLAENMLRFGVKNLQESDIKKIEEAVLNEVNINGVEYKYPFKDETQLGSYQSLMKVNPTLAMKSVGIGNYDPAASDFPTAIGAINEVLVPYVAKAGILPGALPAAKAMQLILQNAPSTMDEASKRAVQNVLKLPQFNKWYTSEWVPKWKATYIKFFGQIPTTTAPQNPQVPGTAQQ